MQHYIYDASGERVLKASSDMEAVYQNGSLLNNPGSVSINGYTSYPSAFLVITADGVYSKHYYAGTQRIVSRLGDTDASLFEVGCGTCKEQSTPKDLDAKKLQQDQKADLQLYADSLKKGTIAYKEYKPTPLAEQEKALQDEQTPPNEQRAVAPPSGVGGLIYYYHPDHLGTSTALTDYFGNAYQFFLNLPFGETMAQQLGSNYYNSPYKFNGKELDEETGFYYYGARYYDPRVSFWMSVDPLAEKYPNVSPYVYCMNNPILYIDPDGRDIRHFLINHLHGNKNEGIPIYAKTTKGFYRTMNDIMNTNVGRDYLSQFMKKGQSAYGYKATKNGKYSDVNINFYQVDLKGKDKTKKGLFFTGHADGETYCEENNGKLEINIWVGHDDANTLTHELFIHHAGKIDEIIKLYKEKGINAVNDFNEFDEDIDHKALRDKNTNHPGAKKLFEIRKQLVKINSEYQKEFIKANERDKKAYKDLK
jgi:RHS repeat-associated protein